MTDEPVQWDATDAADAADAYGKVLSGKNPAVEVRLMSDITGISTRRRRDRLSGMATVPGRGGSNVRPGKVRPAILLWALGVPIPLVILFLLLRGCVG